MCIPDPEIVGTPIENVKEYPYPGQHITLGKEIMETELERRRLHFEVLKSKKIPPTPEN